MLALYLQLNYLFKSSNMKTNKSNIGNIYIVDDDAEVLSSLQWLIESLGYNVISFINPLEFLEFKNIIRPACLVLDVRMPGISGLDLQESLLHRNVNLPIIFMTGHGDVPMAVRAMKAGAVEFLTKPVNNQLLLDAINKAINLDKLKLEQLDYKQDLLMRQSRLTQRERDVMSLIVKGDINKVIAARLNISQNTVELHRSKVMKKMEVKSLAELVTIYNEIK